MDLGLSVGYVTAKTIHTAIRRLKSIKLMKKQGMRDKVEFIV
jgi:hypothetical protein